MIDWNKKFEECIKEAIDCSHANDCNAIDTGKILAEVAKAIAIYKSNK